MGSACSCWRSTARPALTTSVAKCTGNYCATSWRDSTIIAPVSVCHHVSYAERYSRYMVMPAFPGAHLVLIHAHFALAPFEARFNAGARLDDPRQFRQRWLLKRHCVPIARTEVVMVAVARVLLGGIARGAGPRSEERRVGKECRDRSWAEQ